MKQNNNQIVTDSFCFHFTFCTMTLFSFVKLHCVIDVIFNAIFGVQNIAAQKTVLKVIQKLFSF